MAKKSAPKDDEKKAQARFLDQPGQWKNTTPPAVRKRQVKDWKALEDSLNKKKGRK